MSSPEGTRSLGASPRLSLSLAMLACSNSSGLKCRSFTLAFSMIHGGIDCCPQGVAQESYTFAVAVQPRKAGRSRTLAHMSAIESYTGLEVTDRDCTRINCRNPRPAGFNPKCERPGGRGVGWPSEAISGAPLREAPSGSQDRKRIQVQGRSGGDLEASQQATLR